MNDDTLTLGDFEFSYADNELTIEASCYEDAGIALKTLDIDELIKLKAFLDEIIISLKND